MNPDGDQEKKNIDLNERLDELLSDSEEETFELPKKSHIEDLDELTPEELQSLKSHLEATKLNVDVAKWINDLSIRYNQPFTSIMEKREIENLICKTLRQFDSEFTERVIAKMKKQNQIDDEIDEDRTR